jgi:hypothetical protein
MKTPGQQMCSSILPVTSALYGGWWSALYPGRFFPGNEPVHIIMEAGRTPGPVWISAENLLPTGIRFPNRPARTDSLYRMSYRRRMSIHTASVNAVVSH